MKLKKLIHYALKFYKGQELGLHLQILFLVLHVEGHYLIYKKQLKKLEIELII